MSVVKTNCSFRFPTQTLQMSNFLVLKGKEAVSRLTLNLKAQAWGTVGAKQDTTEVKRAGGVLGSQPSNQWSHPHPVQPWSISHQAPEGSAGKGQKAPVGPSLAGCSHHAHIKPHGLRWGTVP